MNRKNMYPRLRDVLGALCLMVIGILLLIFPDAGSAALATVLGWILVAAGGLALIISIASWPVCGVPEIAASVLGLALGIYLLFDPLSLASVLGIGLGIGLGVRCIGGISAAMHLKRSGWPWIPTMVLAVLGMILALTLVFSPLATSRLVMRLCGVGMIVWGVLRMVIHAAPPSAGEDSDIIDADP